jgi:hypothetical protein
VIPVRSSLALLCITLAVSIACPLRADTDGYISHDGSSSHEVSDICLPSYNSHFPVDFGWLFQRYDFDRVEEYVDQYYGTYYKSCERFLTSKQRELAGKFGLSSIFVKPDLRTYENTKIVLTRGFWSNRVRLRYLAPMGDPGDFDVSIAVKPYRYTTFYARGDMDGKISIALAVNKPLGRGFTKGDPARRTKQLLVKAKKLIHIK